MKKILLYFLFACAAMLARAQNKPFDNHWLFVKDSLTGAEASTYDDAKWRTVSLPHDWSIEDLPNQQAGMVEGPFDKNSIGQGTTGFTNGGTGWYRKKFVTEADFTGKLVSIHFDGVYMNSDVWLNGHYLGKHPYGIHRFIII